MSGSSAEALEPPAEFRRIAETLERRGYQAWAVGGAVRDALQGAGRVDWDLATEARPEEVRRIFRRTVPIGIEHGTVGVLGADKVLYEVTTFRRDIDTDGRHAVVEFAETIEEDLARRDFTINAVAWRPATEELRDPFGGREDLRSGVLRAVGRAEERFAEDYLRVLRGLRFAGRFGLTIEEETWAALGRAASHLGHLSAERVREELMKVLADRWPSGALRLYREAGALTIWYPEVAAGAETNGRWELNLGAVDALPASRPLLRLARWLVPVADEAELREARGRSLMHRLRFSNADTRWTTHLLRHYEPLPSPVDSAATLREWLSDVEPGAARDLFRLHFADARAAGASEKLRYLLASWRRVHDEILASPPLSLADLAISGEDLLRLGVQEGPAIGVLLDELHAEVLEDPDANDRSRLLERARELMQLAHLGVPGTPSEENGG
ncbi:MAG: CCA tRNA nucleotidyltransferase [Gemmatimonadota bacterium]